MDLPNLLLIDKPVGLTSFDVIRQLRRRYAAAHDGAKAPKMGHAGTLDPAATGLLLIGVGPGTKELGEYSKLDKEYLAEIVLGRSTTTSDQDGEVVKTVATNLLPENELEAVVRGLAGTHRLPVSAYSAVKQGGQPLYKKARAAARRGETVAASELPWRDMTVLAADYLGQRQEGEEVIVTVRFMVKSGVYIRSLAEELGRQLSLPASLQSLRRTQIGIFDVMHAKRVEAVW